MKNLGGSDIGGGVVTQFSVLRETKIESTIESGQAGRQPTNTTNRDFLCYFRILH